MQQIELEIKIEKYTFTFGRKQQLLLVMHRYEEEKLQKFSENTVKTCKSEYTGYT